MLKIINQYLKNLLKSENILIATFGITISSIILAETKSITASQIGNEYANDNINFVQHKYYTLYWKLLSAAYARKNGAIADGLSSLVADVFAPEKPTFDKIIQLEKEIVHH